ncbi:hypothetical protein L1278_002468 [Pontibacter sp. HSC-36F09]|nr:hypothetical protein [Pontibacter sp. HSC-36F09]
MYPEVFLQGTSLSPYTCNASSQALSDLLMRKQTVGDFQITVYLQTYTLGCGHPQQKAPGYGCPEELCSRIQYPFLST